MLNHLSIRKGKYLDALTVTAHYIWQGDRWKGLHSLNPLGHTLVKELVDSLQLDHLFAAETELYNKDKALRVSNGQAKFPCYFGKMLSQKWFWIFFN